MAERAGFEPAGRWRDHGLASRCLGPLGQRSKKKHWYPRRDSNPQNPVSETGTYASSVTGANTKLVIHFGCALARSPRRVRCFAARGAGRAAAHITIAALTRGCDDGVHGHSRSGARALARHAAGDALTLFFARRWLPHPVRGAPCSDLLRNNWAAPGGAASAVRSPHTARVGLKKTKRPGKPVGLPGRLGAPGLRCLT